MIEHSNGIKKNKNLMFFFVFVAAYDLTGLFAISGFSGGASGGVFGVFEPVFRAVFGQFSGRNFEENSGF